MNDKCETVIQNVRYLIGMDNPGVFLREISVKNGLPTDYNHKILCDWIMERPFVPERREILTTVLWRALDIVSRSNYNKSWEQLCGSDYLQQVKLLAGEL